VAERDVSKRVDWKSKADCMASSVAKCNFDEVLSRIIEDIVGKISTSPDKGRCQNLCVLERMPFRALLSALKWIEASSNIYCNYVAPMD
jgi:hypothetical protein